MIYIAIVYGILTLVGGLIGYLKAGSQASLISGSVSGLLILASAYAVIKQNPIGYYGLLVLAVLLGGWFGVKFFQSHALMPAGLMVLLSLLMLGALWMKKPAFLHG